jgi:hypothetical protein
MNWRPILVLLTLVSFASLHAQQPRPSSDWKAFDFLLGEWKWTGGGQPGQGGGVSTFRPDLEGTVLVRKTHLDYPATKERAAFAHDDLLYIYHEPADNSLRAIFFDGGGHVIRYRVTLAPDGNSVEFLSEAAPAGTTCRMSYVRTGPDSVIEKFEIAPAGKPADFATYVQFNAKRVGK